MALSEMKAFGLREVKLTDTEGNGAIALPVAMTLRFIENVKSEAFLAADVLVAQKSFTESVSWDLETGGISLEAWAFMTGRTVTEAGSSPEQSTIFNGGRESFPYFRIYGRSVGDDGDDIHCLIFQCKVTRFEGNFRDGEFLVTKCSGVAVLSAINGNRFYHFVQHETAVALP